MQPRPFSPIPLPVPRSWTRLCGSAAIFLDWAAPLVALAGVIALAAIHIGDRFESPFVSSVWMAYADSLSEGVFYPPFFDGQRYGGTRYLPLSFLYNQPFFELGPTPIVGLKVASFAAMAAVALLLGSLLRDLGLSTRLSLLVTAAAILSGPAINAILTPHRGDAFPVALQLGALFAVRRGPTARAVAWSGAFCALAVLAKSTAGWSAVSVGLWLILVAPRRLPILAGSFALILVLGVVGCEALSEGRMLENLVTLSTGEMTLSRAMSGPLRLVAMLLKYPVFVLTFPLAIAALLDALAKATIGLAELAFASSLGLLLVMLSDPGVHDNHLIDLSVTGGLAIGSLLARQQSSRSALTDVGIRTVLIAAVSVAFLEDVRIHLRDAIRGERPPQIATLIREHIPAGSSVLTEDPLIELQMGVKPVVRDAYMFLRLAQKRPDLTRPLVERVEAREFDRILLLVDAAEGLSNGWYSHMQFGPELIGAVVETYEPVAVAAGFHVYVPREVAHSVDETETLEPGSDSAVTTDHRSP